MEFHIYKQTVKSKSGKIYEYFYTKESKPRGHKPTDITKPHSEVLIRLINERDKICQRCGSSKNLHVHHKDGNGNSKTKTPNQDLNNLQLLCASCHCYVHSNIPISRNVNIIERRLNGETLASIGRDYSLTRERVRQICKKQD